MSVYRSKSSLVLHLNVVLVFLCLQSTPFIPYPRTCNAHQRYTQLSTLFDSERLCDTYPSFATLRTLQLVLAPIQLALAPTQLALAPIPTNLHSFQLTCTNSNSRSSQLVLTYHFALIATRNTHYKSSPARLRWIHLTRSRIYMSSLS
ncbi:hypothetical protein EDB19DRAFT_1673628 [Suillus lakei]|nr:hypothetical protein EDB19DRAFT_1673628 [Suillus lakei]